MVPLIIFNYLASHFPSLKLMSVFEFYTEILICLFVYFIIGILFCKENLMTSSKPHVRLGLQIMFTQ